MININNQDIINGGQSQQIEDAIRKASKIHTQSPPEGENPLPDIIRYHPPKSNGDSKKDDPKESKNEIKKKKHKKHRKKDKKKNKKSSKQLDEMTNQINKGPQSSTVQPMVKHSNLVNQFERPPMEKKTSVLLKFKERLNALECELNGPAKEEHLTDENPNENNKSKEG